MKIDCISIFPAIIDHALSHSIPGKAQARGLVSLHHHDLRDFTQDKHKKTDDIPYGGGVGMVFKPEPAIHAIRSLRRQDSMVIHPSPAGSRFHQEDALELARAPHLIFIASRYEGLDQRVIDHHVDREYSLGDFVISGGELAAAVMIDALIRLLPGAIGKTASFEEDSFYQGLLDYPHYTRPPLFEGLAVPEVLQQGNHEHIRQWRKRQSLGRTLALRPDLLENATLDHEARRILNQLRKEDDRS